MNIQWAHAMTTIIAACLVFVGSRWWYLRQVRLLARQVLKLEDVRQSEQGMAMQARKQIEELQRVVAQYRQRLTVAESMRRTRAPAASAAEPPAQVPGLPPASRFPPGGWADTQPM